MFSARFLSEYFVVETVAIVVKDPPSNRSTMKEFALLVHTKSICKDERGVAINKDGASGGNGKVVPLVLIYAENPIALNVLTR